MFLFNAFNAFINAFNAFNASLKPALFFIFTTVAKPVLFFILVTITISTANWAGIQFLATHCAKWGWLGPLQNLLSLGSPLCQFVNRVQLELATYYIAIWTSAAMVTVAWITSRFTAAGITGAAAKIAKAGITETGTATETATGTGITTAE